MAPTLCLSMPSTRISQEADARQVAISISNDAHYLTLGLLLDEDRFYSQGLHAIWISAPIPTESSSVAVQFVSQLLGASGVAQGLKIGQEIFTPNDLRMVTPVHDERPFCGWTYFDFSHRFYWAHPFLNIRLQMNLILGLVGPASLGKEVQVGWHELRRQNSKHPELDPDPSEGWSHQLGVNGFPGHAQIAANYAIALPPLWKRDKYKLEIGPDAGINMGSLYGFLELGLQFRFGRLTRTLNHPQFSGNTLGWESFLFGSTKGRFTPWNKTLTGGPSTEVELAPFTLQQELGIGFRAPNPYPELSLGISFWSRETKSQSKEPFQKSHMDYRPELQNRSPWFDHGFGTFRITWEW